MVKSDASGFFGESESRLDYLKEVERWIREVDRLYDDRKLTEKLHRDYWEKLNSLVATLPESMSADPNHFVLYEMRGLLLNYEGRHDESAKSLLKAYELKPSRSEFVTERARGLALGARAGTASVAKVRLSFREKRRRSLVITGMVIIGIIGIIGISYAVMGPSSDNACHDKAMERMDWRVQIPISQWDSDYRELYSTFYDMCKRGE